MPTATERRVLRVLEEYYGPQPPDSVDLVLGDEVRGALCPPGEHTLRFRIEPPQRGELEPQRPYPRLVTSARDITLYLWRSDDPQACYVMTPGERKERSAAFWAQVLASHHAT